MNVVLWIIAGLLAAAFAFAGLPKIALSKEKVIASGQGGSRISPPAPSRSSGHWRCWPRSV